MSGLKIVARDVTGNLTEDVCPEGYIRVTEQVIVSPAPNFGKLEHPPAPHPPGGEEGHRADVLQDLMSIPPVIDGAVTTLDKDWLIDHDNCRIKLEKDEDLDGDKQKKKVNKPAKHTLPLPPQPLTSLHYLDEYILALWGLVNKGDLDKARKFLYGVMMLTKCR
jgi:hypothetical protein